MACILTELREATLFSWGQGQLFGEKRNVGTHSSSIVDLLCDFGQVSLPLWILVSLILNGKTPPSPVVRITVGNTILMLGLYLQPAQSESLKGSPRYWVKPGMETTVVGALLRAETLE